MSDRFTDVGPIRLHYVEFGSGPLIILLHGFPEFWFSWRKQIPALAAAGFRVIAPDLRGYGESSRPHGIDPYFLPEVVKDIAGLIVQNGGDCVLVGHDWGGFVAWYLAMTHPELVRRLIILNAPHPVALAREMKRSRTQRLRLAYQLFFNLPVLPEIALRLFLRPLGKRMIQLDREETEEYVASWKTPGALTAMLNYYRALLRRRDELRPLLHRIDAPTLLIFGQRDPVFGVATTEHYEDVVPHIRVERIATAGHFVQSDVPEIVNGLMIDFARS